MSELDKKISEFVEITDVGDNAVIPVVQGNPLNNYKISVENLLKLVKIPDFPDIPEGHTHPNKGLIDLISQSNIDVLDKLSIDEDGNIKVNTTLWATGGISAYGLGEGSESGVNSIENATDVILTNPSIDDLLKFNGTHWINIPMSSVKPDLTGYATETYVNQKVSQISNDKNYILTVSMPSDIWLINHSLGKYPSVTVINNDLKEVVGDIEYIDLDNIRITFSSEFSGKVICN